MWTRNLLFLPMDMLVDLVSIDCIVSDSVSLFCFKTRLFLSSPTALLTIGGNSRESPDVVS